jgi:hypothetical protein
METQIDLSQLANISVALEGRFDSTLITLEDVEIFARLMRQLVEAAQYELSDRLGSEVVLVTEVRVAGGSIRIFAKIKKMGQSLWGATNKQAAATILAAIIGIGPTVLGRGDQPPRPIDPGCANRVEEAFREFDANARKLPKGYKATFKMTCGKISVESVIEQPGPNGQR